MHSPIPLKDAMQRLTINEQFIIVITPRAVDTPTPNLIGYVIKTAAGFTFAELEPGERITTRGGLPLVFVDTHKDRL